MNDQTNESLKAANESLQKLTGELSASLEKMKFDLEIESALERVRSCAMTMKKQDDSLGICEVLFTDLRKFGFANLRNTQIIILQDDQASFLNYDYSDYSGGHIARIRFDSHRKTNELIDQLKNAVDPFVEFVIAGDELNEWRNWRKQNGEYDDARMALIDSLHYYFYSIGNGAMGISTFKAISAEEIAILKRFKKTFELAYRRYEDVAQAEAQTKESKIELALEKIRARTMAMQRSEELFDTAFVLFQQFQELGEDLIQISIGIMNETERMVEIHVTDWNGGGAQINRVFKGSFDEPSLIRKVVSAWKNKEKSLVVDLTGKDLEAWINYRNLISDTVVQMKDTNGRRVVSLAFFSKGHLSISTPQPRPKETIQLLERFAGVFEQTYTRFLDLQKAESQARQAEEDLILLQTEKKRAEEALAELRETQKLLIQSEKMASLGELTAGIAHEIQNPLNFVNNFSEVSTELIGEMNEEINKGDLQEVLALAADLKTNLEKITHHGKRADAIVKSMLQHSRVSSGIMESTNINQLTDEYLRLTYHGIRAKDYSFNATLKTDYDESAGNVQVIPQDLGRVILNLINNAFYAVDEKKKQNPDGYEATVSVSTKKLDGKVEIQIKDNGNGIPQKVLDKIFQPFFTTKPTGQGTGLGLSLSYDIVKAHGGSIIAESKEGEGAIFTILIPSV